MAAKTRPPKDPTLCGGCGALYTRKQWCATPRLTHPLLEKISWGLCPACQQTAAGLGYGRVLLTGRFVSENLPAIRRRLENVAARAGHTQNQRRTISLEQTSSGLEVITTSQKLAHRMVRELEKAFRGRSRYSWADRDGSLLATWRREN